MDEETIIKLENVCKTYRLYRSHADRVKETFSLSRRKYSQPFDALKDISFELRKGDTFGIIGMNGSGKSTLLQIVSGILQPTSGRVEVRGRVSAILELGTGFNSDFTGRENVYLSASIVGLSKEEIDVKFEEIAQFADIGKFMEQPVKVYSSGMVMRLGFAVQTAVNPEIMVVDEALAVGDMRFAMKCFRKMNELSEKGTAFLFVSHDMMSVANFCQKVIWLHDGKIVESGSPKRVTMNYSIFMSYGLMPTEETAATGMNLVEVEREAQKSNTVDALAYQGEQSEGFRWSADYLPWIEMDKVSSTGLGGAMIERVALVNLSDMRNVKVLEGGERVEVFLDLSTKTLLRSPNACADLRDRKGNLIFGLNPQLLGQPMPAMSPGSRSVLRFKFRFPLVLNGEYSFSFALADGVAYAHVQHHVIPDALVIEVRSVELSRHHYMVSLEDIEVTMTSIPSSL